MVEKAKLSTARDAENGRNGRSAGMKRVGEGRAAVRGCRRRRKKRKKKRRGEGRRSERTRRSLRARRFPLRRLVESAAEPGYLFADSEFDFVQFLMQEMAMKNSPVVRRLIVAVFSHPLANRAFLTMGSSLRFKSCFLAIRIIVSFFLSLSFSKNRFWNDKIIFGWKIIG